MKNLLIINTIQFGYHTDTYYYSKLLKNQYNVTYLCYDHSLEKISINDINVIYINNKGCKIKRLARFFLTIIRELKKHEYHVIFVKYFPGVSFLSFFTNKKNTLLDIRTASVHYSKTERKIRDLILRIESKFYKHVSVISEGLKDKLKLSSAYVIPLGAEVFSNTVKKFDKIKLLYVGTFYNRNIEVTVEAVARFAKEISNDITYKIVGFGSKEEERTIKKNIQEFGLEKVVSFDGRVKINEISKYFDDNNVGVTFIPVTDYYNHQPPTKLFEYGLSGMVNIATATEINKKLINTNNGVICEDNVEGFFQALCKVYSNCDFYNSDVIKHSFSNYEWAYIVKKILVPVLTRLAKD